MADAGRHRRGSRYASGLSSITGGPTLPGAATHPQLPGADSPQCTRKAECQRCSSADVEAAERGTACGHTAKIRVIALTNIGAPLAENGDEVAKPDGFHVAPVTVSQAGCYILDLTHTVRKHERATD